MTIKSAKTERNHSRSANKFNADMPDRRLIVCVDNADNASIAIDRATQVADALGANLLLAHVIEPHKHVLVPFDPVEWNIKRRKAQEYVSELARRHGKSEHPVETKVLEGRCAEQISNCVAGHPEHIVALLRGDDASPGHIGETVRRLVETPSGSLLLIPDGPASAGPGTVSRILVPLDGSARAETAISTALTIARATGAEILLVHARLAPAMTVGGPMEPEDIALMDRVSKRNQQLARDYLDRIRRRMKESKVAINCMVLEGADARRLIVGAVKENAADLLVMASHGRSGFADAPLGDVASFVLARSPVPVLMVRRNAVSDHNHVFSNTQTKGTRRPAAAA